MRATDLVKQILELKKEGKDINVNIADKDGRTALHYAAALGDIESVKALLDSGARLDMVDRSSKTPLDCAQLEEADVRSILQGITIDPDRDEKALLNYLLDPEQNYITVGTKTTKGNRVKTTKENVDSFLPGIISQFSSMTFPSQEIKDFDLGFMRIQGNNLTGRSIVQACMAGHKEVVAHLTSITPDKTVASGSIDSADGKVLTKPQINRA